MTKAPARSFRLLRPPAVVVGLMLLTCLPEIVLFLADRGLIGSARWRPLAYQYGGFWAGLLQGWRPNYPGQPLTMFASYALLHAGLAHLAGNMAALWGLGSVAVERLGAGRFLMLYLIAALGGGVGFGLLTGSPAPMVGASGALFGLAGAWTGWELAERGRSGRQLWPVLGLVAGLVALNGLFWLAAHGLLAWETHLGGYLAGALATRLPLFSGRAAPPVATARRAAS